MSQAGPLALTLKPHDWHGEKTVVSRAVSDVPPRLQERRRSHRVHTLLDSNVT